MGGQPTNIDYRAALELVLDALDIPYAATVGHDETRQKVLNQRIMHTVLMLRNVLVTDPTPFDAGWRLDYLRERLADHPPTGYVTRDQAHERISRGATWSEAVTLDQTATADATEGDAR